MGDHNHIEIIKFSNKNANCLSIELINSIETKLDSIENDMQITSILFLSENNGVFSSGADLKEYRTARNVDEISNYLSRLGKLFLRLTIYPKNVLTIVDGKAVGGALGLIAASDYVVATEKATAKLPELTFGIAPSIISPFLMLKIGIANLKTLSFGAEWQDARRLLQFGLYSELLDSKNLDARIENLKVQFAKRELEPILNYKKSFYPDNVELCSQIERLADENAAWIWKAKEKGIFS